MIKKGFTLVELIVTLAIVSILASIAIPAGLGFIDKKREDECRNNRAALLSYYHAACIDQQGLTLDEWFTNQVQGTNMPDNVPESYEKYLNKAKGIHCPSGGTYEVRNKNEIYCLAHGTDEQAQVENTPVTSSSQPPRNPIE